MHSLIEKMDFYTIQANDTVRKAFITKFQRISEENQVDGGSILRNDDQDGSAVNSSS